MSRTKLQRPAAYTPFTSALSREVNEMRDRMRRLTQEPLGRFFPEMFTEEPMQSLGWSPVVEVTELDNEFTVIAELPGMKAKDVQVDFAEGVLTLRGEKQEEKDERDNERRYHLWERSYGSFVRTFEFPSSIEEDKIRAEHHDGLLEVHLPKRAATKPQGRRVEIVEKT